MDTPATDVGWVLPLPAEPTELEAVDAGRELDRVLIRRGAGSDLFNKLLEELRRRDIPVQRVPVEKLNRVTGKNHQGVIAWLSEIVYHDVTNVITRS